MAEQKKKQVKMMPLWNAIFGISDCVPQNKWHFWNSEIKLEKKGMTLTYNFNFKFDLYWPELDLAWVKCENERHHRILRPKWPVNHVSHDIGAISSYGDLIWPGTDLELELGLAWAPYLYGTFVIHSVALWQSLDCSCLRSGLGSRYGEKSQLWPLTWSWPDTWPLKKNLTQH